MSNQKTVFLLDCGVLLDENDAEFENYNMVYDKKHGYYDEEQSYIASKGDAIAYAQQYVTDGGDGTYAVVSETWLSKDCEPTETPVEGEVYLAQDIVYSVKNVGGKLIENFVEGQSASAA